VAWLTTQPSGGAAPLTRTVKADTTGLAAGTYTGTLTNTATGLTSAITTVTLTVTPSGGGGGGTTCSPVPCAQVKVGLPYTLEFTSGAGGVLDKNGVGTGFTWIDEPATGTGYVPANLAVDTANGVLHYTTANGIAYTQANSQVNGLDVGIAAPNQTTVLSTTIVNPPAGTGAFQQAGLSFGVDQDNYDKLVIMSTPSGTVVQHQIEVLGATVQSLESTPQALTGTTITLTLTADPIAETIAASFAAGAGSPQTLGVFAVPPEFFSFDAAGIDPTIGTRSFGGIFATHRNGPAPIVYDFERFSVTAGSSGGGGTPPGISFTRSTIPVSNPTAMAWGPDGRLYVTELFGTIHAISFAASGGVTSDQAIGTLGSRLALGITVDPASTATDVVLWVSHSNPSTSAGVANSGIVSRLSGTGFTTRTDVITGLPRAIANHATNGLEFGPDGKLYIAQAGNTGAGAANTANTEFGDRAEQPLSAAILVADVEAAGFNGACANATDIYGPVTCSVRTYATGFRNPYDLVWHSNGQLYAPDNGLGVTGTYPPSPTAPCTGFGDTALYTSGGDNPGEQPDLLYRVLPGKYYGHPNPRRGECVFKDGSFQGVAPLPSYMAPLTVLGLHKSSDGIIEYRGSAFCGALSGSLLITNYSTGDDITQIKLSADGTSVVSTASLAGGFTDPLGIAQAPDGRIFVGELGANQITVLKPSDGGC
jgi:glucose/arabinose dehydrogenase